MRIVTGNEIKKIDKQTTEDFGIDGLVLMERAGISTVEVMWSELGDLKNYTYTVFCGPGNNGGDGLVIARELLNYTEAVKIILLSDVTTPDAQKNLNILKSVGGEIIKIDDNNLLKIPELIKNSDVVIDAIFGVGLKREITGIYVDIINYINLYSNYIVSVDIPSGISSDTGKILGTAVHADITVTFEFPKIGHFLFPGREFTGKLKIAKIGIPKVIQDLHPCDKLLITKNHIKLPKRYKESNKGTYGKVIIIGGSKDYIGAPLLSSLAAIRSGVGKVFLFAPENVIYNAVSYEPGIIPISIKDDYFKKNHLSKLYSYIDNSTVIVVGPGIGRNQSTKEFLVELIKNIKVPTVIDADAIYLLKEYKELIASHGKIVLTPHPGELANFLNMNIEEIKYNYKIVKNIAQNLNSIIILKDVTTIISDGERIFFNITGNTSLSKGGSGDILSGLIGGFIAQKLSMLESSITAVYILGLSAELYEYEGYNFISEIINNIPKAIMEVKK